MKYFSLLMSLVYLVAGALLLFTDFLELQVTRFRIPLGIILVAYGVVRGVIWQRKLAQSREQGE